MTDETTIIPTHILDKIQNVAKYVSRETSDWLKVKRELINSVKPSDRKLFSTRHKTSKKHTLNDFEKAIIQTWETLTGVTLILDPAKIHTKEDERPPRSWGLMLFNKTRSEKKKQKDLEAKTDVK